MRIETVNMADVYPIEDEYGNKFTSRDFSTKENKAYVEALAETFINGEPDTPPILICDGGIYLIKDGNCRIEAMKHLGTKRFTAIIDDKDSDCEIIGTVVRTNTKKHYTDTENSRFVQQLMLFADDDYVSKAAAIPVEKVRTLRRSVKRLGEQAEELTLERLIAIEEFSDNDELVEQFKSLDDKKFRALYEAETIKCKRQAELEELESALEEIGIIEVSRAERINDGKDYKFLGQINNISMLPDEARETPEAVYYEPSSYAQGYVSLYLLTDNIDAEAEQQKAERAALEDMARRINERQRDWILNAMSSGRPLMALISECEKNPNSYRNYEAQTFIGEVSIPCGYAEVAAYAGRAALRRWGLYSYNLEPSREHADYYITLIDALIKDGYSPSDEEREQYDVATEILQSKEAGNE